jgi:hypothetical protein
MGGDTYDRDVGKSSSSGHFGSGGTSSSRSKKDLGRSGLHPDLNPAGKIITSLKESPVVVVLDVTGSNIEFARIFYDKAPMLHGQIEQQGYLKDFDICFIATGDAYCDYAPLQVCDFEYGIALDNQLKKLFLEGGGGGGQMETYELAAHYLNASCKMPNAKVPFCFIIGDEAPYPYLTNDILQPVLKENLTEQISNKAIFSKLFKKFCGNVFFIQNPYCGTQRGYNSHTQNIKEAWVEAFGALNSEKIIPVYEEKSIIDIILGKIAMVSKIRDMATYLDDMKGRGQSTKRIENVKKSLKDSTSIVPYADGINLPDVFGKDKKSGGRRF